jgi:predicted GH43/DUF377 family glycosyl hydrolase
VFLVFYRLLKENYVFYVEVLILDEKCKSLLEQSNTPVLEPSTAMIERKHVRAKQ